MIPTLELPNIGIDGNIPSIKASINKQALTDILNIINEISTINTGNNVQNDVSFKERTLELTSKIQLADFLPKDGLNKSVKYQMVSVKFSIDNLSVDIGKSYNVPPFL